MTTPILLVVRSNVIDDTVYMVYFINYTTRNFCNTSQSIRAKSLVIPSIDVTRIPIEHHYNKDDNHFNQKEIA